jgi:hypothetical protein
VHFVFHEVGGYLFSGLKCGEILLVVVFPPVMSYEVNAGYLAGLHDAAGT